MTISSMASKDQSGIMESTNANWATLPKEFLDSIYPKLEELHELIWFSAFVEYGKMIYLDGDILQTWSHSKQFEIGYCQQCPKRVQWPAGLGPKPPLYFNAGKFVYEPSLSTYDDLLQTLKVTPPTSFAEQVFLNMFFRDLYKPVPRINNLIVTMLWRHPENVELHKVKVVHYCTSKPWRYTGKGDNMDREDIKMLVKMWWDIYEDETLDYVEEF
ncbi:hypothetical protein RJ640_008830 [Escallonia rubra]|uniref:Hexosyltransferase n=1 Tax=Escallonia rubra TaxID=112253 RepID=A0AA88RS01_9ASTE|nr:hypothetical protein RJ640_008830 [Escallonia rubra]